MWKVNNANVGREENYEEGGSSRGGRTGKEKGKRVATEVRLVERFISIKKIAPGHRVDLSDMAGMEIIPNLFEDIGWGPLLTVNKLYYPKMIYEFYDILHKGRVQKQGNITYQWVTSRVGGRDISVDDRMLNTIFGTLENVSDHIAVGKIYNKHTFKRIGFSRNEEGMLSDEDDKENEGQEAMNMDEEESEEEPEEETFRREIR
ncbi:hypothetical protein M9H77_35618 [Catharanthus roseus]|uniref:Uncharacterized protein n=1 Tax=Catharanthus roseus TaxID=4058 RepID=A0ACB9ZRF1_CATRO|nr:hypothetical protein M9H77_35618 [Catharanthus roseus]